MPLISGLSAACHIGCSTPSRKLHALLKPLICLDRGLFYYPFSIELAIPHGVDRTDCCNASGLGA
jgi:hypothetical protein